MPRKFCFLKLDCGHIRQWQQRMQLPVLTHTITSGRKNKSNSHSIDRRLIVGKEQISSFKLLLLNNADLMGNKEEDKKGLKGFFYVAVEVAAIGGLLFG